MEMIPGTRGVFTWVLPSPCSDPLLYMKCNVQCVCNLLYIIQSGKIYSLSVYGIYNQNYQAQNYLKVIKIFIPKNVT